MAQKLSLIICLTLLYSSVVYSVPTVKIVDVPSGGPESLAFDSEGALYTGVNDGRIVKYTGSEFVDFAYASPSWTKEVCEGKNDPSLGRTCGRTLGLGFNYATKQLYLGDAFLGLRVVGPEGGVATQALSSAGGLPLKWLDGLDVDQGTGYVYFTDVSTVYGFDQVSEHLATGDSTGRVIEYNPHTKSARVLATKLKGVGGIGCSKDSSYVIFSEFTGNRITKYWLKGPKADTSELILTVESPANVKPTPNGDFWVTANIDKVSTAIRIDDNGKILEQISFGEPYNGIFIQEFHPHNGKAYISSFLLGYLGITEFPTPSLKEEL